MKCLRFLVAAIFLLAPACAELIEPDNSPDGNDTPQTAERIESTPATVKAFIETPADTDYYKIRIDSIQIITISLSVPALRNYDVDLIGPSLAALKRSSKPAGQTEWIDTTLSGGYNYYVKVWGVNGSYDAKQSYLLTVMLSDTATGVVSAHMVMGNPNNAVASVSQPNNYLMVKPQYALSYNNSLGTCNWVSWQLNSSWLGSVKRQDDFRADPDLPAGWKIVNQNEYSGSGYDRGHMCPSGDRTLTIADNSATFVMTNMIPQAPGNNQGPWADLESYCRSLAGQGKELYIVSGGFGSDGTISSGRVSIPTYTWKIIVVVDAPGLGARGVNANTRVIGVVMPNQKNISYGDWKTYRVSVDDIEQSTGFDLLSVLPVSLQDILESRVDNVP